MRLLPAAIIICVFISLASAYLFFRPSIDQAVELVTRDIRESTDNSTLTETPQPTSLPFQELTIPYLRSLATESTLGDRVFYQDRPTYTSYLTSFQSEGLRVNGLLTIPKVNPPSEGWPAVVFIHGYIPPAQYKTTEKYVDYVDYLARNGLVVFKIDLRGHGDSEGEANGAYYSSDYVVDTLHAYSALQNSEFVNPAAVGLWGHSMAGNVVLRTLAARPSIPASVIWAGAVYSYSDWEKYGLSDHSFRLTDLQRSDRQARRQKLFDTHGQFDSSSPFWQKVAATNYLGEIEGTLQLHHAVDDNVVNIGYSRDLVPLLRAAGVEQELFEYSSGGHNISGGSFTQAMQRSVEFFLNRLN